MRLINRVRCYCSDCRAFGRFFGAGSNVLDSQGGTEIVQVAQGRVHITQGLDQIDAIRLSDKGMVRWYTRCCRTPIGNTMNSPGWSFMGLIHTCLAPEGLDQDFGSRVGAVNTGSAIGSPKPKQRGALKAVAIFLRIVISARFNRRDSSGTPITTPRVLQAAEVEKLKRAD